MQPLQLKNGDDDLILEDKSHNEVMMYVNSGLHNNCRYTLTQQCARSIVEWLIDRFDLSFQSTL